MFVLVYYLTVFLFLTNIMTIFKHTIIYYLAIQSIFSLVHILKFKLDVLPRYCYSALHSDLLIVSYCIVLVGMYFIQCVLIQMI